MQFNRPTEMNERNRRTRYAPGAFCWAGLAAADQADAKGFYTGLFGWDAEDLSAPGSGTYTLLALDGEIVATLYRQTDAARAARVAPHWTSYISVEDAAATAARARALGGAVLREPFDVSTAGVVVPISDPTGAIVSLWEPRAHIGATVVDDVGALCWQELVTTDIPVATEFYGQLFDWRFKRDDGGRTVIENAGQPNGGMRTPTEQERGLRPNWLPHFAVESVQDAADRAIRAGGRMVAAQQDGLTERAALLADSQGALFAVRE